MDFQPNLANETLQTAMECATIGNVRQSFASRVLNADLAQKEINPMTGLPFANKKALQQGKPLTTSHLFQEMSVLRESQLNNLPLATKSDFHFEYNFDENGVLYYLGTAGSTRPYENPHILGQV